MYAREQSIFRACKHTVIKHAPHFLSAKRPRSSPSGISMQHNVYGSYGC